MNRRLLITGATGALGQAFMRRLADNSRDFIAVAPSRNDDSDPLDLRNHDQIVHAIERIRPDLIVHLAATFSNEFDEAYAVNVDATRRMLKAVEDSGRLIRVLLIGSAAEYGLVSDEENPIAEDRVLRPVSIYGITKSWQTELAYMYASRGVQVVVARVFNLIGAGLSESLFIGRLHKQIDELLCGGREKIEVGPLSAVRDYISMNDAITQLLTIAEYGEAGEVYHVASGRPITMRELLARELAARGLSDSLIVERSDLSNRRGYDVPSIYADIRKTTALMRARGSHAKH